MVDLQDALPGLACDDLSYSLNALGVVVSHDCDLAQLPENEPKVEIIPAKSIDSKNGNYTNAKNVRKLHLPLHRDDGEDMWIEITSQNRREIDKDRFLGLAPCADVTIDRASIETLQRWLAARYRRSAFPDKFEEAFSKVKESFIRTLESTQDHIRAVLFDIREHETNDETSPSYELAIYLVYVGDSASEQAKLSTKKACDKITNSFKKAFPNIANSQPTIELRGCTAISDNEITLRQADSLKEWRSEQISLRSNPHGPMIG